MKKRNVILTMLLLCALLMTMTQVNVKVFAKGKSNDKIKTLNQAKKLAKKKVPKASVTKVEADTDDGVAVYEVSLTKGGKEYDLTYRASDAKLIEYDWEIINPAYANQSKQDMSKKAIKQKALKKVKNGKFTLVSLRIDDGMSEYKIKMKKGSYKYELVYDSKNGKLLEYKQKFTGAKSTKSSKYIGEAKAKSIALKKAPGATIVKIEFDNDDGVAVYEIEMKKGIYEYDVKINAKTGKVIEFEKDIDD
ncbi:MAG: PepSY domain-containing protein [Lachnospiraceae bacterium]|nr:PepSY domain-containing protein [Lachnospiraceae bacterium]